MASVTVWGLGRDVARRAREAVGPEKGAGDEVDAAVGGGEVGDGEGVGVEGGGGEGEVDVLAGEGV